MKNFKTKQLFLSALTILLFSASAIAQNVFTINQQNSTLIITGTSSIHDWEMNAEKIDCETTLQITDNVVSDIQKISVQLPVSGIKSDNSIMDSKTHKALKEKKFPEISFKLAPNANFTTSENNSSFTGLIAIAGETREIKIACNITILANGNVNVKGEIPIKMSDYNIAPPTAMMGALKTGDDVVIKYNLELNK